MNDTVQVQKIKFNGLDFILTDPNEEDSPIATIKTFQSGECSYAHLHRDSGKIMRFYKQIGTIDDIEFGEFIDIEMNLAKFFAGIGGETWPI